METLLRSMNQQPHYTFIYIYMIFPFFVDFNWEFLSSHVYKTFLVNVKWIYNKSSYRLCI